MANDKAQIELTLKDEYTAKLAHARAATAQFGQSVQSAQAGVSQLGTIAGTVSGHVMRMSAVLAAAAGATVAAIVLVSKKALEANATWVRYTMTMQGFLGSAKAAEEAMAWLKTYQEPSLFELDPLVQAANLLTAFKMDFREVLPLAENLAVAFGKLTPDALLEIVSALGRIKSGRMLEGLEALSAYGVSRPALMKEGIKFDKQGSPQASPEQFLAAVMRVAKGLDPVRILMAQTPEAKWSTFLEKIAGMWRQIGAVLQDFVAPILDKITTAMTNLVDSGTFKAIAESFVGLFSGEALTKGLEEGIKKVMEFAKTIPIAMKYGFDVVKAVFEAMATLVTPIIDAFKFLFGTPMGNMILGIAGVIFIVVEAIAAMNTMLAIAEALSGVGWVLIASGVVGAAAAMAGLHYGIVAPLKDKLGEATKKFNTDMELAGLRDVIPANNQPGGGPAVPGTKALEEAMAKLKEGDKATAAGGALGAIAANTGETARNTRSLRDVSKDYAFGGGDVGKSNISRVSFNRLGKTPANNIRVRLDGGDDAITRYFEKIINRAILSYIATNGGF